VDKALAVPESGDNLLQLYNAILFNELPALKKSLCRVFSFAACVELNKLAFFTQTF
jgi:hypothetical protein